MEPMWVLVSQPSAQKGFRGQRTDERPYKPSPSIHVATASSSALVLPPEM
jgi:hypothetical protein